MAPNSMPMLRQSTGITGGSYAGTNENPLMVINGLSANQNQVSVKKEQSVYSNFNLSFHIPIKVFILWIWISQ